VDCIVCLGMRAGELIRRLISGELTNYEVVRTSPEPLQYQYLSSIRLDRCNREFWAISAGTNVDGHYSEG
jgi:hypothetical protein